MSPTRPRVTGPLPSRLRRKSTPAPARLIRTLARGQVAQAQELGGVGGHADHVVIDAADLAVEVLGHRGQLGAQQAMHERLGPGARLGGQGGDLARPRPGTPSPAWTCSIRWRVLSPTCRAARPPPTFFWTSRARVGDAAGDAGDADVVVGDGGRAGRRGVGHRPAAGWRSSWAGSSARAPGARAGWVQARQVAAQGVQLGAAQLDAVVDLPGEDRELRARRGDAAEVILMLMAKTRR